MKGDIEDVSGELDNAGENSQFLDETSRVLSLSGVWMVAVGRPSHPRLTSGQWAVLRVLTASKVAGVLTKDMTS
ncbi:hypothetical protein TNCV_434041 [Trichonephila clavipes]|nr:hypothetical protein TNCV_434041 [Trichonephila clavipes]